MNDSKLLVMLGCVALVAMLLPIRKWQAGLLWGLAGLLRVTGITIVAAVAVAAVAGDWLPVGWSPQFVDRDRADWMWQAAVIVAVVFPIVTFLDFLRRLDRVEGRAQSWQQAVESTAVLMQAWLDQSESPGATLTPTRRRELKLALDKLHGRPASVPPAVVRTTLAQIVK